MSLPRPNGVMPVASAAASPPLEPPGVRWPFQGLRVRPRSGLSVSRREPISARFVRPSGIPPALFMRSTIAASRSGSVFAKAGTPWVVGEPTQSMFSLMVNGTPSSGPVRSAAGTASAASAPSRALSSVRWTTALTAGLTSSMRARCASTTSRLDTSPDRMSSANSLAVLRQSAFMVGRPYSQGTGSMGVGIGLWASIASAAIRQRSSR